MDCSTFGNLLIQNLSSGETPAKPSGADAAEEGASLVELALIVDAYDVDGDASVAAIRAVALVRLARVRLSNDGARRCRTSPVNC